MNAVLKPIEVVFLKLKTACSGMQHGSTMLLGQHWMTVQHGKVKYCDTLFSVLTGNGS